MMNFKRRFELTCLGIIFLTCFSLQVMAEEQREEEPSSQNFFMKTYSSIIDFLSGPGPVVNSTFMDLPDHQRPSQRVIEALGGGSYLGRHAVTGEPCLLSDDEEALDTFSNFAPCWMNDLYEEHFDEELAAEYPDQMTSSYDGEPPQTFSLRLRQEGVEEFCRCTMAKKGITELAPSEDQNGEVIERKEEILNNLARDGMGRIYDKFLEIQKEVAYSITSREMSGFTTKELENLELGNTSMIEAQTTLTYCMPSEMTKLLSADFETGGPEERLCGERGVRRLAEGMSKGENFDCQFEVPERASDHPKCRNNPMDMMNVEEGFDPQTEIMRGLQLMTGRGARGGPRIHGLIQVLGRHQEMADIPYRTPVTRRGGVREMIEKEGGDLEFSRIGSAEYSEESLKNGGYSESVMAMAERSRLNELSDEGRALWDRNNASIRRAFESAISSSGTVSDSIIDSVDVDRLRAHLQSNPYLEKRLLASIKSDDPHDLVPAKNLKAAVKSYIEKDLYRAYKTLDSPSEYELSALMGITYGPEYYKVLNECEEIQKTMISLCRAMDQDKGEENLGHFFTDARLVDLYGEDLSEMQKGEASRGIYRDFGAASYFFCEENQQEGGIESLNHRQKALEDEFAVNSIFIQMENERQILHDLASKDKKRREDAANNYTQKASLGLSKGVGLSDWSDTYNSAQREGQQVISDDVKSRIRSNSWPNTNTTAETSLTAQENQVSSYSKNAQKVVGQDQDELSEKEEGASQKENINPSAESVQVNSPQYESFQDSFNYNQSLNSELASGENPQRIEREERQTELEEQRLAEEKTRAQLGALSPAEQTLMDQLENMREREARMMEQLERLSQKMDGDRKDDELEQKEEQVSDLRNEMQDLQKELAELKKDRATERESASRRATSERREDNPHTFGTSRPDSRTSPPRDRGAAPVARIPESASPPSSLPSGPAPSPERDSNQGSSSSSGSDSGLSAGLLGPTLTGSTSQSAARISIARGTRIAPADTSLTSLALNADGNVALRETVNPGVLEKVVFKTENGEIVYENGHPVIEEMETVSVDETEDEQALAETEDVDEEEGPSRAPASLEEELLEIERELRPRASHQDLIETLQQNTEN